VKVPVGELPKFAPAEPEAVVGPVLVIPEPARTANDPASPKSTVGCAAKLAIEKPMEAATTAEAAREEIKLNDLEYFLVVNELFIVAPLVGSHLI
jgi:hypothetical protein